MNSPTIQNALLYARTIRRMKPSMIASRLKGLHKVPLTASPRTQYLSVAIPSLDCDENYAGRFDVDSLARNEFFLINERHKVDLTCWNAPEASHLWNFNLHYFEFCIPLAARYASGGDRGDVDQFKRLILTWIATCKYPLGDAWHPYTISLRLVNWLICIDLFSDALAEDSIFLETVFESMYHQYRHLLANQEKHLLANHYFENLKTLLICALLFDEDGARSIVERDFLNQLDEQILPDGVHYERSMMYHKLILEGLLRVELAYRSVGKSAPKKWLQNPSKCLTPWLQLSGVWGRRHSLTTLPTVLQKNASHSFMHAETSMATSPIALRLPSLTLASTSSTTTPPPWFSSRGSLARPTCWVTPTVTF